MIAVRLVIVRGHTIRQIYLKTYRSPYLCVEPVVNAGDSINESNAART